MEVSKAIKKIEKYLGVKVTKDEHGVNTKYHAKYYFTYEKYVGSFLTQQAYGEDAEGNYGPKDEAYAHNWHIRRSNDHSDLMTDYFAGSFRDNCTQMLHSLKPPAPKFPVGALVRGKDNKRAQRNGYAGKTGLVMDTGSYVKVHWMGEEYPPRYNYGFPQRDLELVSAA